ncbi:uncharacterized protein LOC123218081 [Mangifera indica]|uniref:uncharacterized protein LOC123218081 n=1 Tax=Mangifera indica TaxID=29780 RepID=UPI001CFAF1D1|nr:uncharacterized protein LOC123218081 [Mangifera indica]
MGILWSSLSFIFFSILLGCYFLGRARGRQKVRTNPQVFRVPVLPPGSAPSASPPLPHFKPNNSAKVQASKPAF